VLEGMGKTYRIGKAYTLFMSIPAHIVRDTAFPWERKGGQRTRIVFKGGKLIAEPLSGNGAKPKRRSKHIKVK